VKSTCHFIENYENSCYKSGLRQRYNTSGVKDKALELITLWKGKIKPDLQAGLTLQRERKIGDSY